MRQLDIARSVTKLGGAVGGEHRITAHNTHNHRHVGGQALTARVGKGSRSWQKFNETY